MSRRRSNALQANSLYRRSHRRIDQSCPPYRLQSQSGSILAGSASLVCLALLGWSRGWRDGRLQATLRAHAGRLSLPQWKPLLMLAHQMDERRAASKQQKRRHSGNGNHGGGEEAADAASEPTPLGACATLLLLRGMLCAQPASVCLGVLRGTPHLASRLPPCGYVELLHAVQRDANSAEVYQLHE